MVLFDVLTAFSHPASQDTDTIPRSILTTFLTTGAAADTPSASSIPLSTSPTSASMPSGNRTDTAP